MKLYFGIKNLRSVDITPPIELRPITILLGRNNVGKSTFLQSIPMFKQSTSVRTIGPIYWKGEVVDFGDYATAVRRGHEKEGITFSFECENFKIKRNLEDIISSSDKEESDSELCINQKVILQILLNEHNGQTIRKKTLLKIPELDISLEINNSKTGKFENILVNNQDVPEYIQDWSFGFLRSELLPPMELNESRNRVRPKQFSRAIYHYLAGSISSVYNTAEKKEISQELEYLVADKFLMHSRLKKSDIKKLKNSTKIDELKTFFNLFDKEENDPLTYFDTICSFHTAMLAYESIAAAFNDVINNSTYIGPMRAKSKRYHELRNLDYSEITFDGANLPAMLDTLDSKKLAMLSDWLKKLFGFGLHVEKRNGHISIFVKRGKFTVNFSDSGFGISQLVPIATQIWWDLNLLGDYSYNSTTLNTSEIDKEHGYTKILTIEQPELHLHPAHQSVLADLFANSVKFAKDMKIKLKPAYIIETHSEPLVNRIGDLIEDGIISSEDVQILMFSKEDDELTSPTEVEKIEYNAEGYLEKWPYGFFRYKHVN